MIENIEIWFTSAGSKMTNSRIEQNKFSPFFYSPESKNDKISVPVCLHSKLLDETNKQALCFQTVLNVNPILYSYGNKKSLLEYE